MTTCGHVFCHRCISTHLAHQRNCPSCSAYLTPDSVFPNFLLQKVRSQSCEARNPAIMKPFLSSLVYRSWAFRIQGS